MRESLCLKGYGRVCRERNFQMIAKIIIKKPIIMDITQGLGEPH